LLKQRLGSIAATVCARTKQNYNPEHATAVIVVGREVRDAERAEFVPRYFFSVHLRELEGPKGIGTILPDNKAAFAYALQLVGQLRQRVDVEQHGVALIVENEVGETLFVIPF
jgi:uncharacterized protein DUF6894